MGGQICCLERERDDFDDHLCEAFPMGVNSGANVSNAELEQDVNGMKLRIRYIYSVVAEIQAEMIRVKAMNQDLILANSRLLVQNQALQDGIDDKDAHKPWRTFDLVEQHYRHVERHRANMMSEYGDADSAAGAPSHLTSRETSPRFTTSEDTLGSPGATTGRSTARREAAVP
mmetsp:Transcript_76600/g.212811  ORF Transcript_76600/g.212811 Transcript_76600/m.212811 type:complete len:173 (-) Transcript_76600:160-678(-)